jgi:hypothetical protein
MLRMVLHEELERRMATNAFQRNAFLIFTWLQIGLRDASSSRSRQGHSRLDRFRALPSLSERLPRISATISSLPETSEHAVLESGHKKLVNNTHRLCSLFVDAGSV